MSDVQGGAIMSDVQGGAIMSDVYTGWFGLRKEFCPWMLDACPVLQEYGNISYKVHDVQGGAIMSELYRVVL